MNLKSIVMASSLIVVITTIAITLQGYNKPTAASEHETPDINNEMVDLEGNQRELNDWPGKLLIVNFWATWCSPCRKEIPEFITLQQELADQDVQFIGVAVDEEQAVRHFVTQNKINYPILIAEQTGSDLSAKMGNVMGILPYSVILDRNGEVHYQHAGLFERHEILDALEPLLNADANVR